MKNKQALIAVAEWLEAGAKHITVGDHTIGTFDMSEAVKSDGDDCGTACCIAGAIVQFEDLIDPVLKGACDFFGTDLLRNSQEGVGEIARNHLEISEEDAKALFLPWEDFEYDSALEFSDPQRAAKVVRYYLATGVVDWDLFEPSDEFMEHEV